MAGYFGNYSFFGNKAVTLLCFARSMIVAEEMTKIYAGGKSGWPLTRKREREKRALNALSFEVEEGTVLGLVGSNGAGKTTLLRMLSTAIKPTSGNATIADFNVVKDAMEVRRLIGYLTARTSLPHRLTAREALRYHGSLWGLSGRALAKRADDLIDAFEVGSFADKLCGELSTGMSQRVAIARSFVHDPLVVILDEPTTGLDIEAKETVLRFVEQLRVDGKTVLFCTHIVSEVERLCSEILVLSEGEKRFQGTIEKAKKEAGIDNLDTCMQRLIKKEEKQLRRSGDASPYL